MTQPKGPPRNPQDGLLSTLRLDSGGDLRSQLVEAVKAPHRPVLLVLTGNQAGQRLRVDRSLSIGRAPTSDLVVTDAGVSWQHARLEDRGDSWVLMDLKSTNGTSVNGVRGSEFCLADGDKIILARTALRFEVLDPHEQAYDELVERLLTIDDLTGLFVRRKFDADLLAMLDTARLCTQAVGLLVMDLDGIKKINDTHGHLFGAYTIGEAGKVIGRVLGSRGLASRFGGDEFVAALPGLGVQEAASVAEEIRLAIAKTPFVYDGFTLTPGISIGVAAFPESAESMIDLFRRADEALYRAKQAGKNRVCL